MYIYWADASTFRHFQFGLKCDGGWKTYKTKGPHRFLSLALRRWMSINLKNSMIRITYLPCKPIPSSQKSKRRITVPQWRAPACRPPWRRSRWHRCRGRVAGWRASRRSPRAADSCGSDCTDRWYRGTAPTCCKRRSCRIIHNRAYGSFGILGSRMSDIKYYFQGKLNNKVCSVFLFC